VERAKAAAVLGWVKVGCAGALALALAGSISAAAPPGSPAATVEELHAQMVAVMEQAATLGYQGRAERLSPALTRAFDLPFMAEKVVGSRWRDLSPEDQARWVQTFTALSVATYASRFNGYSGQRFETLREEPGAGGTVLVRTRVIDPGHEDIQLDYRMRQQGGRWLIIDVFMNGTVSELALRRSEYTSVLQREGFEALVANAERRIADAASDRAR
jgi:phospholipid transport system substrate-binding protein